MWIVDEPKIPLCENNCIVYVIYFLSENELKTSLCLCVESDMIHEVASGQVYSLRKLII